jgi:hypothetical protein
MTRFFQYIVGDNKGKVVKSTDIIEEDGMRFVCFDDGTRCNVEFIAPINSEGLVRKLMAEVPDSSNVWMFREEWIGRQEERTAENANGEKVIIQPFIEGRRILSPVPPKKVDKMSDFSITKAKSAPPPPPIPKITQEINVNFKEVKIPETIDPVTLTLEKAKKFKTSIPIEISADIPSKELFDIVKSNFEDGENKSIEYIISKISGEEIKKGLKKSLMNIYSIKEELEDKKTKKR